MTGRAIKVSGDIDDEFVSTFFARVLKKRGNFFIFMIKNLVPAANYFVAHSYTACYYQNIIKSKNKKIGQA